MPLGSHWQKSWGHTTTQILSRFYSLQPLFSNLWVLHPPHFACNGKHLWTEDVCRCMHKRQTWLFNKISMFCILFAESDQRDEPIGNAGWSIACVQGINGRRAGYSKCSSRYLQPFISFYIVQSLQKCSRWRTLKSGMLNCGFYSSGSFMLHSSFSIIFDH